MGNTFNKDIDTINWNSLKTENFDENQLTNDSKLLLNRLQLETPKIKNTDTDTDISKLFTKYNVLESIESTQKTPIKNNIVSNNNIENLSETSPFISSDMYKYLMRGDDNKEMKGGSYGEEELNGGGILDGDDSSTSSTSSSSDEKKKNKPKPSKNVQQKYKGKQNIKGKKMSESSYSDSQGLSYVSSSAHTGGGDESDNSVSETVDSNKNTTEATEATEATKPTTTDSSPNQSVEEYNLTETPLSDQSSPVETTDQSSPVETTVTETNEDSTIQPTEESTVLSDDNSKKKKGKKSINKPAKKSNKVKTETESESDNNEKSKKHSGLLNMYSEYGISDASLEDYDEIRVDTNDSSEDSSSDYFSSPDRPKPKKTKSKPRSKSRSNKKTKSYKSKSVIKSVTNENSALPPSSINTSDINMVTEY